MKSKIIITLLVSLCTIAEAKAVNCPKGISYREFEDHYALEKVYNSLKLVNINFETTDGWEHSPTVPVVILDENAHQCRYAFANTAGKPSKNYYAFTLRKAKR